MVLKIDINCHNYLTSFVNFVYLGMESLGDKMRTLRVESGDRLNDISTATGIDQGLLSKYEQGKRLPSVAHLKSTAAYFDVSYDNLYKHLLAEKIIKLIGEEPMAKEVLALAEPRIEYMTKRKLSDQIKISEKVSEELKTLDSLLKVFKKLSPSSQVQKEKMAEHFSLEYTYESNKIEGNTLTLSETLLVIKEGITISGKSVGEHLEAINHSEAIEIMYDMVKNRIDFEERFVLQLNGLILRGIDSRNAGRYRSVNVRISGAKHIPPEPYMVPVLMEGYFRFFRQVEKNLHPVLLAAEMHERLVTIHPFIDGNGRTSRLVMNLILLMHGYPIAILKGDSESRMKYYSALEQVQMDGNPEEFHLLVIDALKRSLVEHIELLKEH